MLRFLRRFGVGLRALLHRERDARDLDDEVAHYLELSEREHMRAGLSRTDAHRAARIELGGVDAVKENVRAVGWETKLETFWQDLRYATRRLRSSPGFTLVAVLSLALGIGANSAIFSLVDAALIKRFPVHKSHELVYVYGSSTSRVFSYPDFDELRGYNTTFDGIAAWGGISVSMGAGNDMMLATGAIVTGNYFDVLGVHAAIGRTIGPSDDVTPGAHPVIVLGDALWRDRFGADPSIVGREIVVNGHRFTAIGVLPPGFGGVEYSVRREFFVPMMMQQAVRPPRAGFSGEMNADLLHVRTNRWLWAVGRLAPNVSLERARASLMALIKDQQIRNADRQRNGDVTLRRVDDGDPDSRGQLLSAAKLVMIIVGLVLLIACANVANLLLARASSRAREIAVRLSLGASRGRLVRQLLTESIVLAALGGAAGLGLAWLAMNALRAFPPPTGALPIVVDFAIDGRVLAFTFTLSVITGIVFGLVPALQASRPRLASALKDGSFVASERLRRVNVRNVLVVAQIAMSLVVLIVAGLFLRSLRESQAVDTGFETDRVLAVPLNINLLKYTSAQGRQFYRDVEERVRALPGVESASLTRWIPLSGNTSVRALLVQGRDGPDNDSRSEGGANEADGRTSTFGQVVSTDYFRTMGIRLLRGRDFTDGDVASAPTVAIVNEQFARAAFPGKDPIGQHISLNGTHGPWIEIVAVAADSKLVAVSEAPRPNVYLPLAQNHETGMTLLVRGSIAPSALAAPVAREIHVLEKNLPSVTGRSLEDWLDLSLYTSRAGTVALIVFGALALLLASVGLYGVMSYAVARRSKELGLRMALGARPAELMAFVLRGGMALVVSGMVLGLVIAAATTRMLGSFLFGVSPRDVVTFVAIPVMLAVVGLAATYVPARRAMRVDPMRVLRDE